MKKRVHLHQLQVGMFVEEVEGVAPGPGQEPCRGAFLIKDATDIEKIMHCHAMSCIINVRKGLDIAGGALLFRSDDRTRLEQQLLRSYSPEEIARARVTIASTAPRVRQLLQTAHAQGTVDLEAASAVVGEIMTCAEDNAGALIGLFKLKEIDEGTFLHSLSVSALMVTFGRVLGMGENDIRDLGIGGLVHDLGKMIIPLEVLKKKGQLTRDEFSIIRSHPQRGFAMLKRVKSVVPPSALDICLYHHEKFDGTGYPRHLRGEAIPYAARIAAICDVYDALTTIRPYKKAWSQAQAVEKMMLASGHFDPELLKMFVSRMVLSGKIT